MVHKNTYQINPKLNKEMKNKKIITPKQKAFFIQKIGLGWINGQALEKSRNELNTKVRP